MTGAAAPSVELTVYGEAAASDANVVFPFDLALPAARDLWALAESVRTSKADLDDRPGDGRVVEGSAPRRLRLQGDDLRLVGRERGAAALEALAEGIAAAWAAARGQQNRINKARWVEHEKQNEGARGWGIVEAFAGEVDYGPPPGQPVGARRRPASPRPAIPCACTPSGVPSTDLGGLGPLVDLGGLRSGFRAFGRPDLAVDEREDLLGS